jgi:putative transposase
LDVKKRFSEEQIIGFLKEADKGVPVKELCRKHGFSEASFYLWRGKYGGMDISDAKRLKALETENARLKKLLAESMLENEVTREALRKKMVTAPARRELVRWMQTKGVSERRGLQSCG